MKKQLKSFLLIISLLGLALPTWGQASTEGKEFWVALNMTTGTGGTDHEPFICITTQHQGGSYTITNPADPSFTPISGLIPLNGYIKIRASVNPNIGDIDLNKWYPVGQTAQTVSNQIKNVGLKVTTTVESSVYVGNRLPQSFDAANILPITALQTDYITQDYPGYDHENKGGGYPVITILATQNNTQVTIVPSSSILNSSGTATITKTLNVGQVFYLTGDNRASLSGTTITSDKKIAVFSGVNNTDVPGPVSARDHLYEQNMPTDYWGTHFVVTRSMKKDANRIRVTASNNGTKISVDGNQLATINAGETYEFELCSAAMRTQDGYTKANAEGRGCDYYFDGPAHYLETSCPCAVFSYDVSENYYIKKDGTSERDPNSAGDPAMVWISPLEQQLRKITFGVMNTDKTPTHYVNIVTPTSGAASLEVREIVMSGGKVIYGNNLVQPSDIVPVPGNTAYSYARIKLTENAESVYTIKSDIGFIAHVYGSGDKESYAYSCGSAAVVQGVKVNGATFSDGYVSDEKFCISDSIEFDAGVGTDDIKRVDWIFGDGTSMFNGPVKIMHQYAAPGWYDVSATLFGRQVCTDDPEVELGTVSFTFRVWRPDTVIGGAVHECLTLAELEADPVGCAEKLANGANDTLPQINCYDDIVINLVNYGKETVDTLDTIVGQDVAIGYNGEYYYDDANVEDTLINEYRCNHYQRYFVHVKHCLSMSVNSSNLHACPTGDDDGDIYLTYDKPKGEIAAAYFEVPSLIAKTKVTVEPIDIILPTRSITVPGKYHGTLTVEDDNDCDPKVFPIDFTINYPSNIFKYKYNNVLAVYKEGHEGNTGYSFIAYQWYCNGNPIPGATEAVYHTDSAFNWNDIYYVELTTADGVTIPSCAQHIENVPEFAPQPAAAPAKKVIMHNRMVIQRGDELYDIYGQKIQ